MTNAPQRRSRKTMIVAKRALAAPTPRGGLLSATDFEKSEWEIMYPLSVEEGLIGPSEYVNKKDT
jgi:hypothetical protein